MGTRADTRMRVPVALKGARRAGGEKRETTLYSRQALGDLGRNTNAQGGDSVITHSLR